MDWADCKAIPAISTLKIVEQSLPGQAELNENEADERGLPDAWIFDSKGWALLIESKVASPIDRRQIRRHHQTAISRGYQDSHVLVISVSASKEPLGNSTSNKTWTELYGLSMSLRDTNPWALKLARYLEVAERRMLADQYLKEGTLTTFTGIGFSTQNPYAYPEARRLLKLLMEKLRTRRKLEHRLGADLSVEGRSAITGKESNSVWNYIPVQLPTGKSFTWHPHLTLAINRDEVIAQITFPHGLSNGLKGKLKREGYEVFRSDVQAFVGGLQSLLTNDPGARPFVDIIQRRYASQRSTPSVDAVLKFDPRTAWEDNSSVKFEDQWLRATFNAYVTHRANLQIGLGVAFPYSHSTSAKSAELIHAVELTWLASDELLKRLFKAS